MKQRHNITLTAEMDERLNQYAHQSRKSRSTVIEEALKQYISGSIEDIHPSDNEKYSLLEARIRILESKIRNIEKRESTNPACFQVHENEHDIISPVVTEKTKIIPSVGDSGQATEKNPDDQTIISLDPEGWYTQTLVGEFLDPSILLSTRKSIVSLAVARGEMETNGKKRKGCRIKGSSAIEWITSMKRKEKPPIFFLGSS
jgi:predicted DNA-binding protein